MAEAVDGPDGCHSMSKKIWIVSSINLMIAWYKILTFGASAYNETAASTISYPMQMTGPYRSIQIVFQQVNLMEQVR